MKDGLFSPAYFEDPYPYYKHLRDHEPIFHDDRIGWMVTRFADIRALAREARLSRGGLEARRLAGLSDAIQAAAKPVMEGLNLEMMRRDDPDHARLRALVGKAFTTEIVTRLRPRIQELIHQPEDGQGLRTNRTAVGPGARRRGHGMRRRRRFSASGRCHRMMRRIRRRREQATYLLNTPRHLRPMRPAASHPVCL